MAYGSVFVGSLLLILPAQMVYLLTLNTETHHRDRIRPFLLLIQSPLPLEILPIIHIGSVIHEDPIPKCQLSHRGILLVYLDWETATHPNKNSSEILVLKHSLRLRKRVKQVWLLTLKKKVSLEPWQCWVWVDYHHYLVERACRKMPESISSPSRTHTLKSWFEITLMWFAWYWIFSTAIPAGHFTKSEKR